MRLQHHTYPWGDLTGYHCIHQHGSPSTERLSSSPIGNTFYRNDSHCSKVSLVFFVIENAIHRTKTQVVFRETTLHLNKICYILIRDASKCKPDKKSAVLTFLSYTCYPVNIEFPTFQVSNKFV